MKDRESLSIVLALFVALFTAAPAPSQDPGPYLSSLSTDPWIPNVAHADFALGSIVESTRDGPWSSPATWGGSVPGPDEVVIIRHRVTLDGAAEVLDLAVYPGGTLRFETETNTSLRLGTLLVWTGGSLEVGTVTAPIAAHVRAELVFADRAIDLTRDPGQYGNGLLVFGRLAMHGAPLAPTFVRLAAEPKAGEDVLLLARSVSGWRPGDRLVLPDSNQFRASERRDSGTEELALARIDGLSIQLSTALLFDHDGARDRDGKMDFLPHIGNLTRNVVLRSENPNGTRGHTLFAHRADIDIRYVTFRDLGRTRNDVPLDNTIFDAAGNPVRIGTNQVARYAVHTHHLKGPIPTPGNGHQFTLIGNAVDGGSDEHAFRWGVAIHGSSYGLVKGNVIYNVAGAGVVTEDGSEIRNVFDGNFVLRVSGSGGSGYKSASGGDGFWFHGADNAVHGNVAADARDDGFVLFMQKSGSNIVPFASPLRIPAFQGADPRVEGEGIEIDPNERPIFIFRDNEAYGPSLRGLNIWDLGTCISSPEAGTSWIEGFAAWHLSSKIGHGVFVYNASWLTVHGLVARGEMRNINPNKALKFQMPRGAGYTNVRRARGNALLAADVQGYVSGVLVPRNLGGLGGEPGTLRIEDSRFVTQAGLAMSLPIDEDHGSREVILRNVELHRLPAESAIDGPGRTIAMGYDAADPRPGDTFLFHDRLLIFDHQGARGDSFEVFYREQAADFPLPAHEAPQPEITNQQAWDLFGIATAGAVAACEDDTIRPDVAGFTCPTDATPPPPLPVPGLFADGFESGDLSFWNAVSGQNDV